MMLGPEAVSLDESDVHRHQFVEGADTLRDREANSVVLLGAWECQQRMVSDLSASECQGLGLLEAEYVDAVAVEVLRKRAVLLALGAAVVSAGRSGGSRSITRDLSETFNDMPGPEPACDADDGATEGFKPSVTVGGATSKPVGTRPPPNGDTLAANKVLGRCLELMKTKCEWMQLFSPKQVRQAIWMDLGGALAAPINSTSTRQLAQNTVDLLHAMGCEPQILSTEAALACWTPTTAAMALTKWRKKLREAFGVADRGSTKLRSAPEAVDPSKVPLPATPRKAATDDGVFAVKGEASPYMQDSHMVTPRSTDRTKRLARETEVGDLPSEWARQVRERSATDNHSSTPKLEITTHLPLCNIMSFYGVRDKSEHSMQWLRTFVYEMRGTHAPPNEWCMPFELKLRDGALYWCRQLPRKTRRTWKLLCDAFIKYYCSKFSQSAKARYYSVKRENKEQVCDYLNRLNGYARNAGDHVEHFLVTCDDRDLEERLCHVTVKGIHDLEDMINDILRHRDRKSTRESSLHRSRSQDATRRRDTRSNDDYRSGYHRERRYRDDVRRRDRRDGSPRRSSVTVVDTLADVMAEWNIGGSVGARNEASYAPRRDAEANEDYFEDERQCSDDQRSDEDSDADYDSDESTRHVAAANDAERRAAADGTFARSDNRRFRNGGGPSNRERDGRRQCGPCAACGSSSHSVHFCYRRCKLCKQVHDAGKCEALLELTKLLKSNVDKKDLSPELQSLLAEPAVDADYLFAFKGESKPPDDLKNNDRVKPTGNGENRDASLVETGIDEDDDDERDGHPTEALITSLAQARGPPRSLVRAVQLLPGERLGWWSSQRYDERKRMRALVNGAVDDARTRLLLDTGANVSVISASFAKRLRVREVRDNGRSLEVRGINPGVMETRRRALVKITLGWEQAYEFEMWIIDHSAGVDVVLGMDFMIPAGIRHDLFHGTARLPDEVMVPLLKSQSVGDDEPYGTQPSCGPTEDLYVPGREWREFRLPRQRLPRSEYDVWVRRTGKLVPTCAKHDSVVLWVPHGELPRDTGYARLDSNKYKEWQVLAYSTSRDETLKSYGDRSTLQYGREVIFKVVLTTIILRSVYRIMPTTPGSPKARSRLLSLVQTTQNVTVYPTTVRTTRRAHGPTPTHWKGRRFTERSMHPSAPIITTEVSTDGENCVDGPDKEDPERLLEANYTSVVHAMVAEGFPEVDDTANEINLSDYAQDGELAKVWKWNGPEMTDLSADEHRSIVRLGDDLHEWRTQHDGYPARDGRRMKLLETMIELPARAIQLAATDEGNYWNLHITCDVDESRRSGMSECTPADETNKDEAQGRVTEASSADINVEEGRACAPDLDLRRCMDLMMKWRYEWIWDRYARQLRFVQGGGA
ncbi:hypothetical protein PHYSODRAFT_323378 [Phytophthora sojae]|uniref:Peptidase A2 domain-containing protein n=1 Tax=Phytophthora sojae (strain P6497) TaxID=1094619 RepID=G4YJH2_PHYSP|nr:hypothetical protein PHYSODRAFT_323378 [Phytophthora sojae]EGZ29927.1 hypothetical protein PHYSODRAFT_323378 [Phytophthora sojae]|eukprot:XP_009517202.1 hypothetical protein PHYSODRAFT_323378 [Phytophthora sojae]